MSTPFYDLASLVVVPSGYKSGKIYAQKPLTTDGQLTFTRASTATRVNASGLIETVASGVPRLDYLGSSCPKILLEPQRVNRGLGSNDLTLGYWLNQTGNTTITTVASGAPDGGAFTRLVTTGSGSQGRVVQILYDSDTAQTASFYVKGTGKTQINLFMSGGGNFTSPEITLTSSWQRISISGTRASGSSGDFQINTFGGNTLDVWGAQVENGSYMTSLIPTTTAAVTRWADSASKTGISSLIGQTEGTIYWEVSNISQSGGNGARLFSYTDGNNFILINPYGTTLRILILSSGTAFDNFISISGDSLKIAVAYKANDYKFYVNGVSVGTPAVTSVPAMSALGITDYLGTGVSSQSATSQMLLFKTRLTNAQLAELTTL